MNNTVTDRVRTLDVVLVVINKAIVRMSYDAVYDNKEILSAVMREVNRIMLDVREEQVRLLKERVQE